MDSIVYKPIEVLTLCPWEGMPKKKVISDDTESQEFLQDALRQFHLILKKPSEDEHDLMHVLKRHLQIEEAKFQQEELSEAMQASEKDVAQFLANHTKVQSELYREEFLNMRDFKSFVKEIETSMVATAQYSLLLKIIADSTQSVVIVISSCKERHIQTIIPQKSIRATTPFVLAYLSIGSGTFLSAVPESKGKYPHIIQHFTQ